MQYITFELLHVNYDVIFTSECVVFPLECAQVDPSAVPYHLISFPLKLHLFIPSRVCLLSPEQRARRCVIRLRNAKLLTFICSNSAFYSPSEYTHESDWLLMIT